MHEPSAPPPPPGWGPAPAPPPGWHPGWQGAPPPPQGGWHPGWQGAPAPPHPGWGPPQAHWPAPPRPPKPPSAVGPVLRVVGGAFLLLLFAIMWLQQSHAGVHIAALVGVFLGGALLLLLTGIAGLAHVRLPLVGWIAPPVGVLVVATALGPFASDAFCVADEASRWDELVSAQASPGFEPARWHDDYAERVDPKYRRAEYETRWMLARVEQAVAHKDATSLRAILVEIDRQPDPMRFADARTGATKAFLGYYDAATARMHAPQAGTTREFPVDESLRAAFAKVLEDLAHAPDADVYVAFANEVRLDPPANTDELLALNRADPEVKARFPGGAPVIDAGDAFTPRYDQRRRQTFMTALAESFGRVFDSQLLTLVPLEDGADRSGKLVLEVHSTIERLPEFFIYDKDDGSGRRQVAGLAFGIAVRWQVRLLGRDGAVLWAPEPVVSEPAGQVSFSADLRDPDWAMYSVMMDSAYYNYSRRLTGNFGLEPPPVKEAFGYQPS